MRTDLSRGLVRSSWGRARGEGKRESLSTRITNQRQSGAALRKSFSLFVLWSCFVPWNESHWATHSKPSVLIFSVLKTESWAWRRPSMKKTVSGNNNAEKWWREWKIRTSEIDWRGNAAENCDNLWVTGRGWERNWIRQQVSALCWWKGPRKSSGEKFTEHSSCLSLNSHPRNAPQGSLYTGNY